MMLHYASASWGLSEYFDQTMEDDDVTIKAQTDSEQSYSRGPGRCDQDTVSGDRCSRSATVEAWIVYPRRGLAGWERFCTQHANYYGVRGHKRTRELEGGGKSLMSQSNSGEAALNYERPRCGTDWSSGAWLPWRSGGDAP